MPDQINNQNNAPESQSGKNGLVIGAVAVLIIVVAVVLALNNRQEKATLQPEAEDQSAGQAQRLVPRIGPPGSLTLEADSTPAVGQDFTVSIVMDTRGHNINVGEGDLRFDPSIFEVKEVSYAQTVFSLKAIEEQGEGSIHIVRGSPGDGDSTDSDDGFTGQGVLADVVFSVIGAPGPASISFQPGTSRLIMDDGFGTVMEMTLNDLSLVIE